MHIDNYLLYLGDKLAYVFLSFNHRSLFQLSVKPVWSNYSPAGYMRPEFFLEFLKSASFLGIDIMLCECYSKFNYNKHNIF